MKDTPRLPIADYREKIIEAVRDNSVVLITAETGAGKSTQVPQYLLEEGYDIVVTQPRRLAARTVATRVAEERGEALGGVVGFRTAYERQDSGATRCLFCTDGLALVRELMGLGRHQVLVLDEVHEWNLNMEVLVAWARRQVELGTNFKVVVMSATLEAEKLSTYFGGVPVISVPGRLFPVEERKPGGKLVTDVADLLVAGRNVLVFQPGKREIEETIEVLGNLPGLDAEILPLHGQLEASEQAKCFRHYPRPKCVVSTNVAQTSVTIDDIDAVVDAGTERRVELVSGVEGLYLKAISHADASQRKGRAGRTKPGIYIDWCPASWSDRLEFPKAEILRTRLDQTVLRLAEAGIDAEELNFFHQPPREQIREAKRALKALGCMGEDGRVTPVGRRVGKLPVSVQYGRMVIEAERLGVVDDVITVAAILEQDGIVARVCPTCRDDEERSCTCWQRLAGGEKSSDILAQLVVYKASEQMSKGQMFEAGVFVKAFYQAKEKRRHLERALQGKIRFGTNGQRENILKAVCAGMVDHLYQSRGYHYQNGDETERDLTRESLAVGSKWVVGLPWDLQIQTRRGPTVLRLIRMASVVDPTWLVEVAPQLAETKPGLNPRYDVEQDMVVSTTEFYFNSQKLREEVVVGGDHPEAPKVFARWLAGRSSLPTVPDYSAGQELDEVLRTNASRQELARQLNTRTGESTFKVYSSEEIIDWFVTSLVGARRVIEVARPQALGLPALDETKIVEVLRDQPDTIEVLGIQLPVEYRAPFYGGTVQAPRVKLSEELVADNHWFQLPDTGVSLPSGRLVEVVVSFGYYNTFSSTSISELKTKVREHLNQKLWDGWSDRPEIQVPDPQVQDSVVPFISAVYGQCVVTGQDLEAYGTIAVNTSRWYSSDPWFKTVWYRDLDQAQQTCQASTLKLEELKTEAQVQAKLEELKVEAQTAREDLQQLTSRDGWHQLSYEVQREVTGRQYTSLPSSIEALEADIETTKAIKVKVEEVLVSVGKRQLVLDELSQYGWPLAHIRISDDGRVAFNCGKSSKMGSYYVQPSQGEREYGPESLDSQGKESVWQPISVGQEVLCQDFSGRGNLQSEVSFTVPRDLKAGIWALGEDERGKFFFTVIYHTDGREIIPEKIQIVREGKPHQTQLAIPVPPEEQKSADMASFDPSKLFGGAATFRRKK